LKGGFYTRPKSFKHLQMGMKRFLNKRVIGYFIWAMVLTMVLVIWRFPYESLQEKLEAVASASSGFQVDLTDMSLTVLPPGLKFAACTVRSMDVGSELLFEATQVHTRFKLLPLLQGNLAFTVHSKAYGGSLGGDFRLMPIHNFKNYRMRVWAQTVRLKDQNGIFLLLGRPLEGEISGDIELEGAVGDLVNAAGGGNFKLVNGSCAVDSPYLKARTLAGLNVSATIEISGGKVKLKDCQFSGKGFHGTLAGDVKLEPRLGSSALNLAGRGQIEAELIALPPDKLRVAEAFLNRGKPLPFRVRGTIAEPRLVLF
jgi:type II secretion system protein N